MIAMRSTWAVMLLCFVASCARDSAPLNGVPVWTIDAKPLMEISTDDSLETIGNVSGVARFADGHIAVGDQSNSTIKFYDANGKFIRNVGRAGSGPGEFGMLGALLHCGDTLFAHDYSNGTFTLVSADAQFGRRVSIALPDSVKSTNRTVCNGDGKFLTAGWDIQKQDMETPGPTRGPIPFWVSDASGKFAAALGTHEGPEKWISISGEGSFIGPRPLGKETVMALGTTRAYIGTADSGTVNVYSVDGKALVPLQIATAVSQVTSADIEAFKMRDTIAMTANFREWWISTMKQMKFPNTLPAYSALLVDSDENVWVRSFPAAGAREVNWWVFSEGGAPVATMQLPSAFNVTEIGAGYIAGVDTNPATGKQSVLVMSWRRPK